MATVFNICSSFIYTIYNNNYNYNKNNILINYDSTFNLVKVRLVSILFM